MHDLKTDQYVLDYEFMYISFTYPINNSATGKVALSLVVCVCHRQNEVRHLSQGVSFPLMHWEDETGPCLYTTLATQPMIWGCRAATTNRTKYVSEAALHCRVWFCACLCVFLISIDLLTSIKPWLVYYFGYSLFIGCLFFPSTLAGCCQFSKSHVKKWGKGKYFKIFPFDFKVYFIRRYNPFFFFFNLLWLYFCIVY